MQQLVPQTCRRFSSALLALASAAAGLFASQTARADIGSIGIAADVEADIPVDSDLDTATGFAGRLGYRLHLPLFVLTPEVGVHYASFDSNPSLLRGIAGARIGFGEVFRFGAFAHVGYGSLSFDVGGDDLSGVSFDIGGFFDFTLLPMLNLRVHAGYGQLEVDDTDALKWIPLGVHLELVI